MKRGFCSVLMLTALLGGCRSPKPEPEKPLAVIVQPMEVPDAVSLAFHGRFPGATIHQITKEVHADGTVHYVYQFRPTQGPDREARFGTDGRPVK